jgi:hypothetical protein
LFNALAAMNRTFQTWRYAYELDWKKSVFGHPWIAAGRLVLEIKPDWVPIAASLGTPATFQAR